MFSSIRVVHSSRSELLSETNELCTCLFHKVVIIDFLSALRSFRIFGLTGRFFFPPIVEGIEINSSKVPN